VKLIGLAEEVDWPNGRLTPAESRTVV